MKTCCLLSPDTLTVFSNSDNYFLTSIFFLKQILRLKARHLSCEQRFLSGMSFGIYEAVDVA